MATSPFFKPGGFLTGALEFGGVAKDPLTAANLMADAGFGWIVDEHGDPGNERDPADVAIIRTRLHQRGVLYGGWQAASYNWHRPDLIEDTLAMIAAAQPDLWVFNIESVKNASGGWQDFTLLCQAFRAAHKTMPAGIVCDTGIKARPFIAANIKAIPECFLGEQANLTPKQMVADFKAMGYTYVFPCLQAYDGFALSNYPARGAPGNGYSVFPIQTMVGSPVAPLSGDWATVHAWNHAA